VKGRSIIVLVVLTIAWVFAPRADAEDTLGFGVNVIPDASDTSEAKLGGSQALWFALTPGQSITRQFDVVSVSDVEQLIEGEILSLRVVDGADRIDVATPSDIASWVTFSPSPLSLGPRQRAKLNVTVTAPTDAEGAFQAFIRVRAEAAQLPEIQSDTPAQTVVRGALAFDQKMWVGVGASGSLVTDFEIVDAVGLTVEDTRTLQIEFANTGETPIAPRGTVELQSLDFTTLVVGPLEYRTAEVLPGQSRYAAVELPPEVEPGPWKVFIVANQGNIQKTASFEKDLTFPRELPTRAPLELWQIAVIALGILLGLLLVVAGWRMLRPSKKGPGVAPHSEASGEPVPAMTAPVEFVAAVPEPSSPVPSRGPEEGNWATQEAERIFRELGLGDDPKR